MSRKDKKNNGTETDISKIEPSPEVPKDGTATGVKSDPYLTLQLEALKPRVEDIARISDKRPLSEDQVGVLREYLSLKENEVRDLKDQRRQFEALLTKLSSQNQLLSRNHRETLKEVESLRRQNEKLTADIESVKDKHRTEMLMQKGDLAENAKKSENYQVQLSSLAKQKEEWRDKVKEDLKRIKLKERELENKYELLKRDTQALLDSKDKHVLELKKKNDALELEMESLEERLRRGHSILGQIESKKRRLLETMKLAQALLEEIDRDETPDELERKKAG